MKTTDEILAEWVEQAQTEPVVVSAVGPDGDKRIVIVGGDQWDAMRKELRLFRVRAGHGG